MTSPLSDEGYQWKKLGGIGPARMHSLVSDQNSSGPSEFQQGYDEGHAEGYQAGNNQAQTEQRALISTLQGVLDEAERLRERTVGEGLQDIALALQMIFRQVFGHELQTAPELIHALTDELRQALQTDLTPKIELSRDDYDSLSVIAPSQLAESLHVDDELPTGVLRASVGLSMLELDVVANFEEVLANAVAGSMEGCGEPTA